MSIVSWLLLGLLAGFIGSRLVGDKGGGLVGNVIVGMIGAVIGGWIFRAIGSVGVTGLNLWSVIVASVGSAVLLYVFHALRRTR